MLDPKSCAQCHTTKAAGYGTTGMAHAFYRPQAKDTVEVPARDRQFSMQRINPYEAVTRANIGRLLAETDWKQAAFQLQKAVQLDPADVNAHLAYSVVLLQMDRLPEAEREAEVAMKTDPKISAAA
jgi:Tfp pilus assembly protein PilF